MPKLDFPKKFKGRYWTLYWIGKIYMYKGELYCNYYFVNHKIIEFSFNYPEKKKIIKFSLVASLMSYLEIGSVFLSDGIFYTNSEEYFTRKNSIQLQSTVKNKIRINNVPKSISNNLPFIPKNELKKFTYFKIDTFIDSEKLRVIIPSSTLCKYFYFKNHLVTNLILSGIYDDVFKIISKFTFNKERNAAIEYDNKIALPEEIHSIVQYSQIKNKQGIKSLNHISSSIKINHIHKNECYLNFKFPFNSAYKIELSGKYFKEKGEKLFLAFSVIDLLPLKTLFNIDKILLIPKYREDTRKTLNRKRLAKKHFVKDLPSSRTCNACIFPQYTINLGLSILTFEYISENLILNKNIHYQENISKSKDVTQSYKAMLNNVLNYNRLEYNYINLTTFEENLGLRENIEPFVLEVINDESYIYHFFFSYHFSLNVIKKTTISKISSLEINLICKKLIQDYYLNNNTFKQFKKEDETVFESLFNIKFYHNNALEKLFNNEDKIVNYFNQLFITIGSR